MAELDATRACVVCGVLFPRDGKRTLCSEKCRTERQRAHQRGWAIKHGLFAHRAKDCQRCGKGFSGPPRQIYCTTSCGHINGAMACRHCSKEFKGRTDRLYCGTKCKDAARRAAPGYRDQQRKRSHKYKAKPLTEQQRQRRNQRKRGRVRDHAKENGARMVRKLADLAPAMLWIDASYHMAHAEALAINAEIDRAARESLKAERDKQDALRAERAKQRGLAASTLKLKEDPEKYAATLTYWRAKSLKRKTGQAMRSDGTATSAVILGGKRCLYCDCTLHDKNRTHDHMRPLSRGGVHSAANIAPCCLDCNSRKGAKGFEQWVTTLAPKDSRRAVAYFEKRNGSIGQGGLVLAA